MASTLRRTFDLDAARRIPAGLAGGLRTGYKEQLAAWLGRPLARLWRLSAG